MRDIAWTPIGTLDNAFGGTYNGQNLAINNLTYNGTDYSGLFGNVANAKLEGILLDNAIISGNNYVGAVAGRISDSVIDNYLGYSNNVSVTGSDYVGGIAGFAKNTVFNTLSVTGTVTGSENIGGIAGGAENSTLKNNANSAEIKGTSNIAGLVGNAASGSVLNSYNVGDIGRENSENVGGIAGANGASIENCYNIATVVGSASVGELAGASSVAVKNNYYLSGKTDVGTGSENDNTAFELNTADNVAENLNLWLDEKNSSDYYSWYIEDEGEYPVFGALYSSWISDISVSDDEISFSYSDLYGEDATVYVAMYGLSGNLVKVIMINISGEYHVEKEENAATAKVFLWDSNYSPLEECKSVTF